MKSAGNARWWDRLFLLGLVLVVLGAKLTLIDRAGSSLPIIDQIDAEGEVVLRPWLEGQLSWRNFWHPHNEHRVVLTKLLALGLVKLNGQWDAYLEQVVGAVMHAVLLPWLLCLLRPLLPDRRAWWWLAAVMTLLWSLPLNWENTLIGFQNQFYFVLWLAVLQLQGVLGASTFSWRWVGGNLCGLLALGAMSSGSVASAAVAVVMMIDILRARRFAAFPVVTLLVSLLWVGLGSWWRFHFAGHDALMAQSAGQFLNQASHLLAWPYPLTVLGLAWWLVTVPLAVLKFLRQDQLNGTERVFLGLAAWTTLIAIATAYFRANGDVWASRYVDQLNLVLVLQAVALTTMRAPRWRWTLIGVWSAASAFLLIGATRTIWREELAQRGELMRQQEAHVRTFLATDDPTVLRQAPPAELPLQWPEVIIDRWSHRSIQQIMPAAVRRTVPIAPAPSTDVSDLSPSPYPVIVRTPTADQRETWRWQSRPQTDTTLPVLRFRFWGELGADSAPLRFRVVSDAGNVEVTPDQPSRDRWKTINVIRPAGTWWLEVSDSDDQAFFALTAPVELGWWSWASEKLIKHHTWFLTGGVGFVLLSLALLRPHRNEPSLATP